MTTSEDREDAPRCLECNQPPMAGSFRCEFHENRREFKVWDVNLPRLTERFAKMNRITAKLGLAPIGFRMIGDPERAGAVLGRGTSGCP